MQIPKYAESTEEADVEDMVEFAAYDQYCTNRYGGRMKRCFVNYVNGTLFGGGQCRNAMIQSASPLNRLCSYHYDLIGDIRWKTW